MRHNQAGLVDEPLAEKEQVEVDRPRPQRGPTRSRPRRRSTSRRNVRNGSGSSPVSTSATALRKSGWSCPHGSVSMIVERRIAPINCDAS